MKTRNKLRPRVLVGITLGAVPVGVGSGVAWAFTIDTITPTSNYGFACAQGSGPNTGSVCQPTTELSRCGLSRVYPAP